MRKRKATEYDLSFIYRDKKVQGIGFRILLKRRVYRLVSGK